MLTGVGSAVMTVLLTPGEGFGGPDAVGSLFYCWDTTSVVTTLAQLVKGRRGELSKRGAEPFGGGTTRAYDEERK